MICDTCDTCDGKSKEYNAVKKSITKTLIITFLIYQKKRHITKNID